MQPTAQDIDQLRVFPFLSDPTILASLKVELPSYLAKSADISPDFNTVEWWSRFEQDLPQYGQSVAKKVILLQPSSAAAERVFSLLNSSFSEQQQNSLEDYVEASVMLQYNKR